MKPLNWKKLSHNKKYVEAGRLFNSIRGKYLISQALSKAIDVMKEETNYPEVSNIEDMEMLEVMFPIYSGLEKAHKLADKSVK